MGWREHRYAPAPGTSLCRIDSIPIGECREIRYGEGDEALSFLLYRSPLGMRAYINKCPHFSLPLNARPGRFFLLAHEEIMCAMDEATMNANDSAYLDRHLRSVITKIERCPDVELIAIGIGHDVTRYYRRSVTLSGAETLGEAVVTQLIHLFKRHTAGGRMQPCRATDAVP